VKGGEIVATGTPEAVAKESRSFTGAYLAPLLERGQVSAGVEKEAVAAE
jgi:excinuclease ABC subunit A